MDIKASLLSTILLLSALDSVFTLSLSSQDNNIKENEIYSLEGDAADYHQGKNVTDDFLEDFFAEGRSEDYSFDECDGPSTWAQHFPKCGGYKQSPININLAKAMQLHGKKRFIMRNYNVKPHNMTLKNTGNTVVIEGSWGHRKRPFIRGGILRGVYVFKELHFNWGASRYEPSNHLINGYGHPLEMDVVHYKRKYGSFENATKYRDGVAIISYIYKIGNSNNSRIQSIINQLSNVISPSNPPANLPPFRINRLAPRFNKNYATYKGSLTRPPCDEVATRIVYLKPLSIGCNQIDGFRQIRDAQGNPLIRNFRPVQKRNGRKVFVSTRIRKHH